MDINQSVPFVINTLDTIVVGAYMLTKSVVTLPRLPDVCAGKMQHSRHAADPPQISGGRPPWLRPSLEGPGLSTGAWDASFKENAEEEERDIFEQPDLSWLRSFSRTPLKRLCANTRPSGRTQDKYLNTLTKLLPRAVVYLLHAAGVYCIVLML